MSCQPAAPSRAGACPEWELLLCAARSVVDVGTAGRTRDLAGRDVDWNRLIAVADLHHVSPLLYHSLNTVCPRSVPPGALSCLAREFAANAARNRALSHEPRELLKTLAEHEINAIAFKGPTLASLAYGGLAPRQAGDLDVVVRERDAKKARQLLMSRGFRPCHDVPEARKRERSHDFMLVRDERPVTVEIHWRLIRTMMGFRSPPAMQERCPAVHRSVSRPSHNAKALRPLVDGTPSCPATPDGVRVGMTDSIAPHDARSRPLPTADLARAREPRAVPDDCRYALTNLNVVHETKDRHASHRSNY